MVVHGLLLLTALIAQAAPPSAAAPEPKWATDLAAGWTALAAGRTTDAEASANAVLRAGHARHEASSLKIHARLRAGHPESAIDGYDEWAQNSRRDDVFLLQPIASAILAQLARSTDDTVKLAALHGLARNGDGVSRRTLEGMGGSLDADTALATLGDARAIARLRDQVASPGPRGDVGAAIAGLAEAKATAAIPAILSALDPAMPPPTRLAAARALGLLGARDAIPQLQQCLNDPDGALRMTAAAALARLGDRSGASLFAQMENSPVADIRLMAAEVVAPVNPSGAWMAVATSLLQDPDPLVRLQAADLLVRHAADANPAFDVLEQSLADGNPALRTAAARVLSAAPGALATREIGQLKRLLRDSSPQIRVTAASALLQLAGGIE